MALRAGLRATAAVWGRGHTSSWLAPAPATTCIGVAQQPSTSFSASSSAINPPSSSELNALLYRARQRGFLELDILLGKWAEENAASLDAPGRAALADLLRAENPDLFVWLTGQAPPPAAVASNPVFQSIAGGVAARLAADTPAAARAAAGVAWKRGWDDKGDGGVAKA